MGEAEDIGEEQGDEPTLATILRAVNKCTVSVNHLQARFGGLKEEVILIRQERTTAAESIISDIEVKIPPLLMETQSRGCLTKTTVMQPEDFEIHLRSNNV